MASENETGIMSFKAGEALEPYRRVKFSGANVVYAAAGDPHIGVTENAAAINAQVAVKLNNYPGTRKLECSAAVTINATVYGSSSGRVDDTITGNGPQVGIALDTGDGAGSIIEVMPISAVEVEGGSALLHAAVGDSAALGTGSAAEATFSNGSYTFAAGALLAGDLIRVKAKARLDATNGADTFTMRLKVGTETIATTPNPDAVNGDIAIIEADIAINIGGAGGQVEALGNVMNDALVAGLATPFHKAAAAEDLSGAIILAVTGQFSAADAGNTAKMDHFTVERIRK